MEKELTAVQWLKYQMLEASIDRETGEMFIKLPKDAFKQAKSMEKEQIQDAWYDGFANGYGCGKFDDDPQAEDAEQYYNETFKSE